MEYPTYTFDGREYNLEDIEKVTWSGRRTLASFDATPKWTIHTTDGASYTIDKDEYCLKNDDFRFWMLEITFPG